MSLENERALKIFADAIDALVGLRDWFDDEVFDEDIQDWIDTVLVWEETHTDEVIE